MSMVNRRVLAAFVAGAVVLVAVIAYIVWPDSTPRPAQTPGTETALWDGDPMTLLESHRGQVLVLLLGMDGCPGTRAATEFLTEYVEEMPAGASIVRLDVPPPAGEIAAADAATLPFGYAFDRERVVASELEFFYYPTLYILDGDGEVRFSGKCDPDRVRQMVAEIAAEAPGAEKHVYTLPMPATGTAAPSFSSTTLDGETATLSDLLGANATVLIFAKTGCPFTVQVFPGMKQLADAFRDKGVAVAIVNSSESVDTIRSIYAERAPGVTVIADETGDVAQAYSGDAVPFSFVLDGEGTILARMPYTQDAATDALNLALGLTPATPGGPATGAG